MLEFRITFQSKMKSFTNLKKKIKIRNIIIYIHKFRMLIIHNFFQTNLQEIFLKRTKKMKMKNSFRLNKI